MVGEVLLWRFCILEKGRNKYADWFA